MDEEFDLFAAARRALETSAEEATRRAAQGLRSLSDERLEQLMRTGARRPIVESIFWLMPRYLDRSKAIGVNVSIRWRIRGPEDQPDVYDLVIVDRRCRVHRGRTDRGPIVTITVDDTELVRLATGKSTPMQSYFAGRLSLRGDLMQAARLLAMFRPPPRP